MNIKLTEKEKIQVDGPHDLYGVMQRILLRENKIDRDREHFWIVGMNQASTILYIELIGLGSSSYVLVEPMNVYRVAVLKGATHIVAVHNHPAGILKPSKEDLDITDRLIQVGIILDIKLQDHLIINTQNYMSFKFDGVMDELGKSLKYVPPYQIADKIKAELTAKTVKGLLNKQMTVEQIAGILDITPQEVEKIKNEF